MKNSKIVSNTSEVDKSKSKLQIWVYPDGILADEDRRFAEEVVTSIPPVLPPLNGPEGLKYVYDPLNCNLCQLRNPLKI